MHELSYFFKSTHYIFCVPSNNDYHVYSLYKFANIRYSLQVIKEVAGCKSNFRVLALSATPGEGIDVSKR